MIELTFGQLSEIVSGKLIGLSPNAKTKADPVINSKSARPGTFFAAFEGVKADGHDYAKEAIAHGAEFVLGSKETGNPTVLVTDVQLALTKLAAEVRSRLTNLKVIGITGSQGKTTTKDLLRHVLEVAGKTVAPEASLNNELGVPLLILKCDESTKFCIVEMGARHRGDIAHLASIAKPQIGVVLTVGSAHIGEFGSREAIAETKRELILGLPKGGTAVLGTYDEFTPKMADGLDLKVISFGENSNCDVRAADLELREGRAQFDLVTNGGRATVSLQLLGMHQVSNALAAAAVATALSVPIESIAATLSTAELSSHWRMELSEHSGIILINDSYNANPESMGAALRTLALLSQERGGVSWAFLGAMHELGELATQEHQGVGRLASEIGVDQLVSIGTKDYLNGAKDSEGESQLNYFPTYLQSLSLVTHFQPGDVVLVKASRAENFEKLALGIIEALKNRNISTEGGDK
jgi:UDP-N-acetylmuramoyl-tripeptide--D-alanyl-D-alanine ligase